MPARIDSKAPPVVTTLTPVFARMFDSIATRFDQQRVAKRAALGQ
jgi:hypothetical protein